MSRSAVPYLTNTAGEPEQEARSRRFNLFEALTIMVLILVSLWPLAFYLGRIQGYEWAETASVVLIGLGAVYILFVSPWIHRDTLGTWGLGNPRTVWRILTTGSPLRQAAFATLLLALYIALNYVNYSLWPEVADFFAFDKIGELFGAEWSSEHWTMAWPGRAFVLAFGAIAAAVVVLFAIRYDNFGSAFLTALKIAIPFFLLISLAAFVQRGPEAFTDFDPPKFFLDVFGYVFWGFTQQLLFSAYFGTRFRLAFDHSRAPGNATPERRWQMAGTYGAIGAVTLTLLLCGGIAWVYGASAISLSVALWLLPFMFGISAVFGYAYALDRKRMLVAVLSASCFGLIHIDSYLLVAGTWLLGTLLVYVFMEDRNRNLVALGFIHGLNGSTFGWLFSSGKSGTFEVDYSVGPYGMDDPRLAVLWIPLLCIAAYLAIGAWYGPRLHPARLA